MGKVKTGYLDSDKIQMIENVIIKWQKSLMSNTEMSNAEVSLFTIINIP